MRTNTSWTNATENPYEALMGLISCMDHGIAAWIEVQKNGEQDHPIRKKNPELNSPFNWDYYFGVPRTKEALKNHTFFNETERELTERWVHLQGGEKAVKAYQEKGTLSEDLVTCPVGEVRVGCPVRIEDANKIRKELDGYQYGYWMDFWKPKDGIPYWVVDTDIDKVFVVCHQDKPVMEQEKAEMIWRAGVFMMEYANQLKEKLEGEP